MNTFITDVRDAVKQALKAAHSGHTVESFPDDVEQYQFLDPVAAHLVIFMDTERKQGFQQYGADDVLLPAFDVVQLTHELDPVAYDLLEQTADALHSLEVAALPPGHPLNVESQTFADRRDGPVWLYRTRVKPWNS